MSQDNRKTVLVVGGIAVDELYRARNRQIIGSKMLETSTPCRFLFRAAGGVGRNLADVIRKLLPTQQQDEKEGFNVDLLSAVGDDMEGNLLLKNCNESNIGANKTIVRLKGSETAKYVAILDGRGELAAAADAMSIFESDAFLKHIENSKGIIRNAAAVVIDCNLPALHLRRALELATTFVDDSSGQQQQQQQQQQRHIRVIALDPISIEKGRRCVPAVLAYNNRMRILKEEQGKRGNTRRNEMADDDVIVIKPNHIEAAAMVEQVWACIESTSTAITTSAGDSDGTISSQFGSAEAQSDLHRQLDQFLPKHFTSASSNETSKRFLTSSSSSTHFGDDNNAGGGATAGSLTHATSGGSAHGVIDEWNSQRLLIEAARNAVILSLTLESDIVLVSCGQFGSVACFPLSSSSDSSSSNNSTSWITMNINNKKNNNNKNKKFALRWFPPIRVARVVKVTGAGDTYLASLVSYLLVVLPTIIDKNQRHQSFHNLSFSKKTGILEQAVQIATENAARALTTASGTTPQLKTMHAILQKPKSKL